MERSRGCTRSELVFRVPRDVFEFELRGGVPASSDNGVLATYAIVIDLDVPPAAPEAIKQRTDEEITLDASSVTLVSPSAVKWSFLSRLVSSRCWAMAMVKYSSNE